LATVNCTTSCARGMQAAFRVARSRLLISALLDLADLKKNPTLATTLRAIHAELVQASQSLAITRVTISSSQSATGVLTNG
jgi:hypothetical protein